MHWDMRELCEINADVLFMANYSSRDFLRCLSSTAPTRPGTRPHRVQLLTFNSNDPKGFAESLRRFSRAQETPRSSNPLLACSVADACSRFQVLVNTDMLLEEFKEHSWPRNITNVLKSLNNQAKPPVVRRDVISGADDIWLARPYPMFGPGHVKLQTPFYSRQATQLKIKPTGSRAEIWKVFLDYQPDPKTPATFETICVAVKKFFAPPGVDNKVIAHAYEAERKGLAKMMQRPHPNVLALLGSFEADSARGQKSWNLIFPFARGGDLYTFMRLPSGELQENPSLYPEALISCHHYGRLEHGILEECLGLLEALSYIHEPKNLDGHIIIHRDIKPANILIHNGKFKLADFGVARIKSGATASKTQGWIGTEEYSPPERFRFNADEANEKFGRSRDAWGLGCVLLELIVMFASSRHDQIPSVEMFESYRTKSSDDEPKTSTFARTMTCVESTSKLIGNFRDSHLDCLRGVAMMMLEVDCDLRPTAHDAHQHMRTSYTGLQFREEDLHWTADNETPENTDIAPRQPRETQPPSPKTTTLSPPQADSLAHFWYLAFWKNNPKFHSKYRDGILVTNLAVSIFLIIAVSFISVLQMRDSISASESGFLSGIHFIWLALQDFVSGVVFFLSYEYLFFALVPWHLLRWLFAREAAAYVASYSAAANTTTTTVTTTATTTATAVQLREEHGAFDEVETERNISSMLLSEDLEIDYESDGSQGSRRSRGGEGGGRGRRRTMEDWAASARAGARAGRAFTAWTGKRIVKPVWGGLMITGTAIFQVARYSARMEEERRLRRANGGPLLPLGRIAL